MTIAPVLQRFVDDELALAPALIERALAGTLQLLRDTKDSHLTASERAQQFAVVEALQLHGAAYQRKFVDALRDGVRESLQEQQTGVGADAVGTGSGLELMDESRVEVDIEISRAMQLIDTTAEWELRELQTFTSTLTGQSHVSAESNPLRPLVYATALWEAACDTSQVQLTRTTLLRVSAGVTAGLLKSAWAAACTRLESQGVTPGIYRTVLMPSGTVTERNPMAADAGKPGAMSSLLANMPGGSAGMRVGAGNAGTAMGSASASHSIPLTRPEFEQALARLDELLRQLPAQSPGSPGTPDAAASLAKRMDAHRAALVASASAPIERQIIELLSRVFDTILSDPQIPPAFVPVLARLQASALRVALREREMFDSTMHPVWQLLNRIGEAACGTPQPSDPRAAALVTQCHVLAERLARAATPNATLYRGALSQLDAFVAEQLQSQLRLAQPTAQALQLTERREVLEQQLAKRLVDQMAPLRTTPGVRRFVTSAWARVLAEAMLRDGEQAESTRGYIKLVDELLWSVQLPDHPQSRQRLVALLPSMLQRLRTGMSLIRLPSSEQEAFLNELMAIHTEALRPGGRTDTTAPTPEQIVQRMRDEVLPAMTGHGGFSDSVIDLSSMETVPAEMLPTGSDALADDPVKGVDALRQGDRLRLFLGGRWCRVQLLWRSDQSQFFLFAGETPARTHSVTRRALERLNSAGLMQPLEVRPLVQRALDVVMREAGRPA